MPDRTVHGELVAIPGGPFRMGSDTGQPDERPVHEVWVDRFSIAVHPVTNEQYDRFVAATQRPRSEVGGGPLLRLPRHPVVGVSWFDATAYCAWLASATGLPFRLPTEAEREKAARGGADGWQYPWGSAIDGGGGTARDAVLIEVRRDTPNGHGLHNMGDLVHEWCADWYDADYYRTSPARNPAGPEHGTRRVSRGGSWRHLVPVTRCAARSSLPPERCYADYGFRVALSGSVDARAVT